MQKKNPIRIQKSEISDDLQVIYGDRDIEYTIQALDIDPKDLEHWNSKYTPTQKIQVCTAYLATGGNAAKSAKLTGVPSLTIRKWKSEAPWWDEVMAKCRAIKQDELDAIMTGVIHETVHEITDRIRDGDYVLNRKTGDLHRVPMSGRDLSLVATQLFEKRQLLRGDATKINKSEDMGKNLQKIEDRLLKTISDAKEKRVVADQKHEFKHVHEHIEEEDYAEDESTS